jgi:hypothetical protein
MCLQLSMTPPCCGAEQGPRDSVRLALVNLDGVGCTDPGRFGAACCMADAMMMSLDCDILPSKACTICSHPAAMVNHIEWCCPPVIECLQDFAEKLRDITNTADAPKVDRHFWHAISKPIIGLAEGLERDHICTPNNLNGYREILMLMQRVEEAGRLGGKLGQTFTGPTDRCPPQKYSILLKFQCSGWGGKCSLFDFFQGNCRC